MKNYSLNISHLLIVTLLLIAISGCGGGTRGTGDTGNSFVFRGIVQNEEGQRLENTDLLLLWSGETIKTDETGTFEVETSAELGVELTIEVKDENVQAQTSFGNYQLGQEILNVILEVSTSSNTLTVLSLTINTDTAETIDEEEKEITQPNQETPEEENTPLVRTVKVKGTVVDLENTPVFGAIVKFQGQGARARTGSTGNFILSRTPLKKQKMTLQVTLGDFSETIEIAGLPKNRNLIIELDLKIAILGLNTILTDPDQLPTGIEFDSIDPISLQDIEIKKR